MRICSLSPSATEMLCLLGLLDDIVGVSHRCDYPPEVVGKPVVSGMLRRSGDGTAQQVYELDAALARELRPDVIVTQELCEACAVPASLAEDLAKGLLREPQVVSMNAFTLDDILGNVERLGTITGRQAEAHAATASLRRRVAEVAARTRDVQRPRVAFLEWLDPLWIAGNWVPELVQLAGGVDGLGPHGARSLKVTWADLAAYAPDVVLIAPCGLSVEETMPRIREWVGTAWEALPAVRHDRVYALDGRLYSRYTPRIVDGLEALAAALHPEVVASPADPSLARRFAP